MALRLTRSACASLFACIALDALPAQELLHYKFDSGCGSRVLNYATTSPAPREATLLTNFVGGADSSWTTGPWGHALAAGTLTPTPATYAYVDTGWNPGTITGSLTWACWIKADPNVPAPSLTYLFGNGTSFRVFTGGGGGFLLTASWGGLPLGTTTDVLSLARTGWTHVALVLDDVAGVGRYYVNGVPEAPLTLLTPVGWTGSSFYIGRHASIAAPSIFDINEFMLVRRALSGAEVAALAAAPTAAVTRYGSGCGGLTFDSSGGQPTLGNASFALTLASAASGTYTLFIGTDRCRFGAVTLPYDLGGLLPQLTGCRLEANPNIGAANGFKPTGTLSIPLAIPNTASFNGATLYMQAATVDNVAGTIAFSNALSLGLGR